jgi:hypothetical protein
MTKSLISILFLLIVQLDLFAQTEKLSDSLSAEFYKTVKKQEQKIEEDRKIRDSLREAFYKEPAIIGLSFEKNNEKIALNNNYDFWIENDGQRNNPKSYDTNQFLADSISDTIAIVFKYEKDTLRFSGIGYGWIKYGAGLRFGIIENLEEIRRIYKEHKRDEDFNEYLDLGQPYLRLIKNKKLKRQKKKIGEIIFVVISPRVYGDGAIMETVTIKPRKK